MVRWWARAPPRLRRWQCVGSSQTNKAGRRDFSTPARHCGSASPTAARFPRDHRGRVATHSSTADGQPAGNHLRRLFPLTVKIRAILPASSEMAVVDKRLQLSCVSTSPAPSVLLALGNGKTSLLEMRSCPAVWRRDADGSKRTNCRSSIEGLRRPGRIESAFPGGRVRWGNAPGPPWLRRQKGVVPRTDGVETIGVGRGPRP
jgi:hypothetical protein